MWLDRKLGYSEYFIGLGFGTILGSLAASTAKFPTSVVTTGFIFVLVGLALSYWLTKKGK